MILLLALLLYNFELGEDILAEKFVRLLVLWEVRRWLARW